MTRLLVPMFVLLHGCGGWGQPECADDGECSANSVCDTRSYHCKEVECTSSAQCGLGTHCDPIEHTCVGGCADNDDCIAGEICTFDGQCEPYGCRTTELDCHYGENCVSGECIDNPDPHCMAATSISQQNTCINEGGALACFDEACNNVYCLMPCNASADSCPRGTACYAPFLNNTATYCTGDCPFLNANGF